jgi:hypothetical protein
MSPARAGKKRAQVIPFVPGEIDGWAIETNERSEGKYWVVRIVDDRDRVVWPG